VPLAAATRAAVRQALRSRGVRAIREDDRYWFDKYDGSGVLRGCEELAVGYTARDGRLAVAQYRFAAGLEAAAVAELAAMVTREHGPPDETPGPSPGERFDYRWFPGDVAIRLHRDGFGSPAYLTFEIPALRRQLDDEMAAAQVRQAPERAGD